MKIGYVRVSTQEQSTTRQEVLMNSLGVEKVYIDRLSGKDTQRPQLQELLSFVREGDTVIVDSISRFARNTRDLLGLVEELTRKKVEFVSRKEAIDTDTPTGKFMLTVFGAVAELERDYTLQRQQEGIKIAKAEGKYRGRKPIEIDAATWKRNYARWKGGEITGVKCAQQLGLSRTTFYAQVQRYERDIVVDRVTQGS